HGGLATEPCPPGQQVAAQRDDDDREEMRRSVPKQRTEQRTAHAITPAPVRIQADEEHTEEGHVVQPGPLDCQRAAERDTGGEAPPAETQPRASREVSDSPLTEHHPVAAF